MFRQTTESAQQLKSNQIEPDRVLLASKVLAGIVVPVLVVAFVMLYLLPDNSGQLFAWPINRA